MSTDQFKTNQPGAAGGQAEALGKIEARRDLKESMIKNWFY